jgi:hypothetical protein
MRGVVLGPPAPSHVSSKAWLQVVFQPYMAIAFAVLSTPSPSIAFATSASVSSNTFPFLGYSDDSAQICKP